MLKTTIKGLLAHKVRLVTTMVSIVLGVALMAGSLMLTDTVKTTFSDLYADIGRGTDTVVRAKTTVKSQQFDAQRGTVSQELLDQVKTAPGVKLADGAVTGYAQFVDKNGKAMGNPGQGAPTYGMNWPAPDSPTPWNMVQGVAPRGPDELVMDKASADKGGFQIGERVKVLTQTQPREFTIVGITRFRSVDSPLGASIALFDMATAQQLVGTPGQFNEIDVVAADGVSQEQLATDIGRTLPASTEAITGAAATNEAQTDIEKNLSFFGTFLLIFALVALLVGCFIIYNTFSIIVAQRMRELALLRALGASRKQVRRAVLIEAMIVGLIASGIGLVVGMGMASGLKALLAAVGIDIPATGLVITSGTIIVTVGTGLGITVLSAWFPARRASKIPPIAALRETSLDTSSRSHRRLIGGGVVTALGVGTLVLGLFGGTDVALPLVGVGALLIFLGIAVLGPVIAVPVGSVIGAPVARTRGVSGRLARANATRNPRRTSATASALMIGVALVVFLSIFATTTKNTINDVIDRSFQGDLVIDSGTFGFGGISADMADRVQALPEIQQVVRLRMTSAQVKDDGVMLMATDPTAGRLLDLDVRQGDLATLDAHGIAVSEKVATDRGYQLGDTVDLTFTSGVHPMRVDAIYARDQMVGGWVTSIAAHDDYVPGHLDSMVYVSYKPGTDLNAGRAAVERVASGYPNATVQDLNELKAAQAKPIDQMLSLMYALLGLAVLIALMGIANTLALSIHERTRELGLLRSVGMSRAQLRSSVRWESVIIALFGTALGLGVGLFFGWALVKALASQGFGALAVPIGQLVVVTVLAAIAGVVAAILPARRAARLDILDAIAS